MLSRNLRKSIFEGRAAAALTSLAYRQAVTHCRAPFGSLPRPFPRAWLSSPNSLTVFSLIVLLAIGQQASAQTTNVITSAYGPATIGSGTTSLITNGASFTGIITDNGLLLFQQNGLTITDTFAITGSGSLTMNGTGTTTLTGNKTYTGSTLISGGTLALGYGGVLYSGTWGNYVVTVTNGGVLQVGEWGDGALNNGGLQNNFYAANLVLAGGTLRYSATLADAGTMDRGFTIGTGGATLEAAGGTNTWNLVAGSRGVGIITANNNNLTLSGSNNGLMGLVFRWFARH